MENQLNFEVVSDEELAEVSGGNVWRNIARCAGIGADYGGVPGAILGGVVGWALTPTHVS
ncbi:lactococcin family bacteriocin [Lactococcus lactis]|uniref:lactococcin family bacteriocin n=1 Tax=Lactococcus lactis TaxID=1358 RepID=UPI002260D91E|nr:lactococcin family bacteriocin [Lactococcus lactis]MCX7529621.1 lactococcin family bacteriocin [Lactococcus lactis]MDM7472653.1 lactococcin family bacteriocin [Lactococcus lactis]MDN5464928.1 lactococcin family bacteriocin [Lactococcus lactis]